MIRAIGFSLDSEFNPYRPGRLCRGRERWITPWEPEEGQENPSLTRLVITGAEFEDDSARDARRGLTAAGVALEPLLNTLFAGKRLLVFCEDGHPADIPDGAEGVELYDGYRAGGKERLPLVRWYTVISSPAELDWLTMELAPDRVQGFAVLKRGANVETIWEKVFALVGMSNLDSPPARYNPAALPELLELTPAVGVLHRDKHGPVFAIYTREKLAEVPEQLEGLASEAGCLLVPFAIPPMLARWDRALYELRQAWDSEEPFPVPHSDTPSHWEARRARRRRNRNDADAATPPKAEDEAAPAQAEQASEASASEE